MQTLVIYDDAGTVITTRSGDPAPKEPLGVPFLWAEVPEGKRLKGVDNSSSPHQAVLEDIPPTDEQQRISDLEATVAQLMMGGS